METQITDSPDHITFQTTFIPQTIKQNKLLYTEFTDSFENAEISVRFNIKLKHSFSKKNIDLIKNDHVILQNHNGNFFLLFQAKKELFQLIDDINSVFEENVSTENYNYTITFHQKKIEKSFSETSKTSIKTEDISTNINTILQKYGINEKIEDSSPVTEYMKKWNLEHPDAT